MKILIILFILLFSLLSSSCFLPAGGGVSYAPLYKYKSFPLIKVQNLEYWWPSQIISNYEIVKTAHQSYGGFISNNEYYLSTNNTIEYYSNDIKTVYFTFTNTNNRIFLCANRNYVAYFENSNITVIMTNGQSVFTTPASTTNLIADLGKGESPYFAYGEQILEPKSYDSNYGLGHLLKLRNLETTVELTLPNSYNIIGFSKKNKYLFYTIYTYVQYMSYDNQQLRNIGQLAYYNINKTQNKIIGDINYETNTPWGQHWTDAILGIDKMLKYFLVLQQFTSTYAISGNLDDGRDQGEECGIWKVDISSLGLSE